MPLSTSNFNGNPPHLAYRRIAAAGLLLLALLVPAAEGWVRARGFEKHVEDSKAYWAFRRSLVYEKNGKKKLVILGSSRSVLGLVPEVFRKEFPGMEVIHLGIEGKNPYAVLKDMSEDPRFNGWILCDTQGWQGSNPDDGGHTDYYHTAYRTFWGRLGALDKLVNTLIKAALQNRWVLFSPELRLPLSLRPHLKPKPFRVEKDRYQAFYFRKKMTAEELKKFRKERMEESTLQNISPFKEEDAERFSLEELRRFQELMTQKGGRIFLVRMPTSEDRFQLEELIYPKNAWDRIYTWSGIRTIHFKDYPQLSSFECPDSSHLDAEDAPLFSERLARIMKNQISEV